MTSEEAWQLGRRVALERYGALPLTPDGLLLAKVRAWRWNSTASEDTALIEALRPVDGAR